MYRERECEREERENKEGTQRWSPRKGTCIVLALCDRARYKIDPPYTFGTARSQCTDLRTAYAYLREGARA